MNLPNLLTLLRFGLIPFFVISLVEHEAGKALVIFLVAGLTDGLDGFVARFFGQVSVLGSYLDPVADKLMLTVAYVMLSIPGMSPGMPIPVWVTVLVIARDLIILLVALVLFLAVGITEFRPTWLSKTNTVVQIVGIVLVLLAGLSGGLDLLAVTAVYLVATLTVASGLDYVRRAHRMVAEKPPAARP